MGTGVPGSERPLTTWPAVPVIAAGRLVQSQVLDRRGELPRRRTARGYAGKPLAGWRFSVRKRVSVVVDVGFAQMLGLGILVMLVLMVDCGMAVLVIVSDRHVLPVRPVTMIVNDVSVLMTMHGGVMMMHRHCSCASNSCVRSRWQCRHGAGLATGPKVTSG